MLVLGFAAAVYAPQAPVAEAQASGKIVVFVTGYGAGTLLLSNITTWLEGLGATVRIATTLNDTILAGADALIFGSPYGPVSGISELSPANSPALLQTIWDWWNGTTNYKGGGKFLWMGSDSDYQGRDWISMNSSKILETVGSHIRYEPCEITDPFTNCGASYRPVANVTESVDPDGAWITTGVTHGALIHGPTLLYGVNGTGHDVGLHNNTIPGVFNILYTNYTAEINESNPTIPAHTVVQGQTALQYGNFVAMAGEKDIGYWGNSRIIATGASPYGDYQPMYTDEYYGVTLDGPTVVKRAILWGLNTTAVTVPGPPTAPTLSGPVNTTDGQIQLTWTAADDDSGIIRYTLAVSNSSTFAIAVIGFNYSGSTLTATIDVSSFGPGTYWFHIRAADLDENPGPWSNAVSVEYILQIPTPPPPIPGFPFEAIILGLAAIIVPVVVIRRRRK
jgi:hypothetical protein